MKPWSAIRSRLHEALKAFPSPDDVSSVVNGLVDQLDEEGMAAKPSPPEPWERINRALLFLRAQLLVILVLLAVIAVKL